MNFNIFGNQSGGEGASQQDAGSPQAQSSGGYHWSILPILGNALGMGGNGQQQGSGQSQGQNWSILPLLGHILGMGGGGQQGGAAKQKLPVEAGPQSSQDVSASLTNGGLPISNGKVASTGGGPSPSVGQPINTQTQMGQGLHGAVPTISHWFSNKGAAQRDTMAQPHVQTLQSQYSTPEQRSYAQGQLQNIYGKQPQVLQQLGMPAQSGGYSVPSVGTTAGGR